MKLTKKQLQLMIQKLTSSILKLWWYNAEELNKKENLKLSEFEIKQALKELFDYLHISFIPLLHIGRTEIWGEEQYLCLCDFPIKLPVTLSKILENYKLYKIIVSLNKKKLKAHLRFSYNRIGSSTTYVMYADWNYDYNTKKWSGTTGLIVGPKPLY